MCKATTTEEEEETVSDTVSVEEDEDVEIIRAKWILDGCATIADIIERLKAEIEHYTKLKEEGWELTQPVEDDYGYIKKS
jgi:hypothetical protein